VAVCSRSILGSTWEDSGRKPQFLESLANGTGIEPKNMQRIFDSFFTTKLHGMGMGLSICRSIIETHGGRLLASSAEPHGTVFKVILPTASIESTGI
jgi:two-component system, LuxR family, sensor kinase FixL